MSRRVGKTAGIKNFSQDEDVWIEKAYAEVTSDAAVGTDQDGDMYNKRIGARPGQEFLGRKFSLGSHHIIGLLPSSCATAKFRLHPWNSHPNLSTESKTKHSPLLMSDDQDLPGSHGLIVQI